MYPSFICSFSGSGRVYAGVKMGRAWYLKMNVIYKYYSIPLCGLLPLKTMILTIYKPAGWFSFSVKSAIALAISSCCGHTASQLWHPMHA